MDENTIPTVDVADVPDPLPAGLVVLDVREDDEWASGHVDGAIHIPLGDLPARADEVLVNDSHGDMQNLLHTELDPRVTYIQGAVKPVGMVEGLDSTRARPTFWSWTSPVRASGTNW